MKAQPPKIVNSSARDIQPVAEIVIQTRRQRTFIGGDAQQQVDTRPCFASSWIEEEPEREDETVLSYEVGGVSVTVKASENQSYGKYLIDPPEYRLNPAHLQALSDCISDVVKSVPADLEIESLAAVKPHIKARAKDLLYSKLASKLREESALKQVEGQADFLADILCKYSAGYGILETLLEDKLVQDIYVDAPSSQTPVQVVLRSDAHPAVRQKCRTNILVGRRDLQGFVSRVKFETGLPFSEAHPVLEADIGHLGARITLVGPPLSDKGVSVAIRKHSEGIWTIPMLIANGSLSPLLASFLWACVIGRRTALVAGSRGAGKTTLLGAMLLEFPLSQRIILLEDTPELSVRRMQALGFDIQALRFSANTGQSVSSAEDSLRVSLRMGESAIVIGEVRGAEAKVLYESMRAGSAGSAVLGTIHGNSARGVLDRAVEDLGVSERAFSSTDIVVVIGLIRSPDGTRFHRRVTEVAEVRAGKDGVDMVSLFETSPGCSCAKPTAEFTPECKTVTGISKALGVAPEGVMDIVKARAHADQLAAERTAVRGPLGDDFRVRSNEMLTKHLFDASGPEAGLREWRKWFDAC